jgi:hypothetical protein
MTGIRPSLIAASRRRVFNPLSLSPALWLSDTGSSAGTWPDLSGNGRDATQATPANQPAIIPAALNGRQVRRFDGSNDSLAIADRSLLRNLPGATLFVVANPAVQSSGDRAVFSYFSSTIGNLFYLIQLGSQIFYGGRRIASDAGDFTGYGTFTANVPRIITTQQRWSTAQKESWATVGQNNLDTSFQTAGNSEDENSAFDPSIGRSANFSGAYFNGDIAEMLLLPYAPTTADRQRVESYLSNKWGIALV